MFVLPRYDDMLLRLMFTCREDVYYAAAIDHVVSGVSVVMSAKRSRVRHAMLLLREIMSEMPERDMRQHVIKTLMLLFVTLVDEQRVERGASASTRC